MPDKKVQEAEKVGFDYKKWYEDNKEAISERRKKRYAEDAEYREKCKTDSSRYYWLSERRAKSVGLNRVSFEELELKPDMVVQIEVTNEHDVRFGMVLDVPMYYASQLAPIVRRSQQTIRLWFSKGLLDDAFCRDGRQHRMYTEDQLRVFAENRHWLSFGVQRFVVHPFFTLVNEGVARLEPDGIEPMLDDEWRLDPTNCPFCGAGEALQRKVGGVWKYVNCFKCLNPFDARGRMQAKSFVVRGSCSFCGYLNEMDVDAVSADQIHVTCDKCARPLLEVAVREKS